MPLKRFHGDGFGAIALRLVRRTSRLRVVFALLMLIGWSTAASAHPGHHHDAETRPGDLHAAESHALAAAEPANGSQSSRHSSGPAAPCGCPGGCCARGGDCLTHCAVAAAIPNKTDEPVFPGRLVFERVPSAPLTDWSPGAQDDPPKPSA